MVQRLLCVFLVITIRHVEGLHCHVGSSKVVMIGLHVNENSQFVDLPFSSICVSATVDKAPFAVVPLYLTVFHCTIMFQMMRDYNRLIHIGGFNDYLGERNMMLDRW